MRRDIVQTIRQVVDVVSRYAGGALPEPARGRVRGFILELPQRWARKAGPATGGDEIDHERERDRDRERERESVAAASGTTVRRGSRRAAGRERGRGAGASSTTSSRATSPIARHPRHQEDGGEPVSAGTAILAAQRILTLATESLDMMRGVTGVVKDSLDRADAYVHFPSLLSSVEMLDPFPYLISYLVVFGYFSDLSFLQMGWPSSNSRDSARGRPGSRESQ